MSAGPGELGLLDHRRERRHNVGGLCCVKYGVTREWVQRLEAVLPGGELLQTGHLPRKGA